MTLGQKSEELLNLFWSKKKSPVNNDRAGQLDLQIDYKMINKVKQSVVKLLQFIYYFVYYAFSFHLVAPFLLYLL